MPWNQTETKSEQLTFKLYLSKSELFEIELSLTLTA